MILAEVMFKLGYGWVAVHYANIRDKHDTNLHSFLRHQRFYILGSFQCIYMIQKTKLNENESTKPPLSHF